MRLANANSEQIPFADETFQMCVTSPPFYGLRDYGEANQIGLEESPQAYIDRLVTVFREVWRVLKVDGVLWLNLGDSYAGSGKGGNPDESDHRKQTTNFGSMMSTGDTARQAAVTNVTRTLAIKNGGMKPKDLMMIPARVAMALQADGWYLRSEIVWHKPNPMPESVTDRPTRSHEMIYLLAKSDRYYYDRDAIRESQDPKSLERMKRGWNGNGDRGYPAGPQNHIKDYMGKTDEEINSLPGRNKRDVWTVNSYSYAGAHFATYPPELIKPCILAGSRKGDRVLDPFVGSGTTIEVCNELGRMGYGLDLSMKYLRECAGPRAFGFTPMERLNELPMFAGMMI